MNTAWCRYNAATFHKYSQNTPHSSPVRAMHGVSFVDPTSDWYSALVFAVIPAIFYYIGSRYNGTLLCNDCQWLDYARCQVTGSHSIYCYFAGLTGPCLPRLPVPSERWEGHDDVIKWRHFPRYWPFVRGIHRSPMNSPHKVQWRGALIFFICGWINAWVNNREAGDLRRHRVHYDVIVMISIPCDISVPRNSRHWKYTYVPPPPQTIQLD